MAPENVDLWSVVNIHVVTENVRFSAYVDICRVVSPFCPDQTAAVLVDNVITILGVSSRLRGNANNLCNLGYKVFRRIVFI